jgi:hypothetical protein
VSEHGRHGGPVGRHFFSGAQNSEEKLSSGTVPAAPPPPSAMLQLRKKGPTNVASRPFDVASTLPGASGASGGISMVTVPSHVQENPVRPYSCNLHGVDPETCVCDVSRILAQWPRDRFLELAPKNWAATRARVDPAELDAYVG